MLENYYNFNDDRYRLIAEEQAFSILSLIEAWLGEPGAEYVLGAGAEYSLADVFATTFLNRLKASPIFF